MIAVQLLATQKPAAAAGACMHAAPVHTAHGSYVDNTCGIPHDGTGALWSAGLVFADLALFRLFGTPNVLLSLNTSYA